MANEEVYYSALHYAAKAKKYAEQTKDVKEEADTAIALVDGFSGTVDAAKTAIINLSDEKKTDIRNEGATQVTAVSSEGTKQVGLVNTASATAQQQIAAQSANLVTLDGNQTVSGQKTFTNGIDTKANNIDVTTAPTADVHHDALEIRDVNGVRYGIISTTQTPSNQVRTKLMAQRTTADGATHYCEVSVVVDADGTPSTITTHPKANSDNNNIATTHWVRNVQPLINAISATSGTVTLAANKVYTMSISDATTFTLPTNVDTTVFNQIKVMAKVTGTPTITWGTTNFFNKTTPEIEAGSYDVYFDWDNLLGAWVCGVLPKGAAS